MNRYIYVLELRKFRDLISLLLTDDLFCAGNDGPSKAVKPDGRKNPKIARCLK